LIHGLGSHGPFALKLSQIVAAVMAQLMQQQAAPEPSLDLWRPENAANAELADCIAFPAPHHLNDVVTTLEQEALRGGADFVGK